MNTGHILENGLTNASVQQSMGDFASKMNDANAPWELPLIPDVPSIVVKVTPVQVNESVLLLCPPGSALKNGLCGECLSPVASYSFIYRYKRMPTGMSEVF